MTLREMAEKTSRITCCEECRTKEIERVVRAFAEKACGFLVPKNYDLKLHDQAVSLAIAAAERGEP
jgi:hypothetical protein